MDNIKNLIENSELTLYQIAGFCRVSRKTVRQVWMTYSREFRTHRKTLCYSKSKLGKLNPMFQKNKEAHPNYKGIVGDCKGYLMVLKPEWFTGRVKSKHVFYHHVVVCSELGITRVPPFWCVHHCDKNPHNNSFTNLILIKNVDHRKLHSFLKGATTISKESTLKWVEAHGTPWRDDIV